MQLIRQGRGGPTGAVLALATIAICHALLPETERDTVTLAEPVNGLVFLRDLGRKLRTGSLIYVRADSRILRAQNDTSIDLEVRSERAAHAWLSTISGKTLDVPDDGHRDPHLLIAPIQSATLDVLGVVVAARVDEWTDDERRLFRLSIESNAGALDARAVPVTFGPRSDVEAGFEAELRNAVDNDELRLVYQPEFDLVTREVTAAEALVRWQHPRYGQLGPEWFISLAERSDLIKSVGAWVIDEAIRNLARWNAAIPGLNVTLRVNVSPVQLSGSDIVEPIAAALERHGVSGRQLCVELTENAPYDDLREVVSALRRLKQLGVAAAIDDLATGYSTLSHLRVLPVDMIKIDRSLVAGIDVDRRARTIVTALIGLAVNFGLQVIAEGVENEQEATTLTDLGCTRAQGHHLGRPMHATAITNLLAGHRMIVLG